MLHLEKAQVENKPGPRGCLRDGLLLNNNDLSRDRDLDILCRQELNTLGAIPFNDVTGPAKAKVRVRAPSTKVTELGLHAVDS